jgi:methylmalonyl-CoA mutase cobalamin-binding domain/chain
MKRPIRVLIAKVGLDGHDRGAKVVARCLRDAGMDVIYTGLHRTPEEVVIAALQEDVDVLGVSLLSGAHMTILPKLMRGLRERGADDVIVVAGGVIPDADVSALLEMGVAKVLSQDTRVDLIPEELRKLVEARHPNL